ncbi:MAG: sigma factor-like helix-turn-helix DNA-binding protein [Sarcina sp.]
MMINYIKFSDDESIGYDNRLYISPKKSIDDEYKMKVISELGRVKTSNALELRRKKNTFKYEISIDLKKNRDLSIIFKDSKYRSFLGILASKKITDITKIKSSDIVEFANKKGNGIKKILEVIDILSESYVLNYKFLNYKYDIYEIKFWFAFPEFSDFREICLKKGIETIDEIDDELLSELVLSGELKSKKMKKIKDRLKKFSFDNGVIREKRVPKKLLETIEIRPYWLGKLGDMKIVEIADMLSYNLNIDETLFLADINGKSIYDIKIYDDFESFISFIQAINNTKRSRKILANVESCITNEREMEVIKLRYKDGETLENIGKKFNITRERVRQIETKCISKIRHYISRNNFKNSITLDLKGAKLFDLGIFYRIFGEESVYLTNIVISCVSKYKFYEPLNIVFEESLYKIFIKNMTNLMNEMSDTINISEDLGHILEYLNELGIKDLKAERLYKLLLYFGYKVQGDYASKKRLTAVTIMEIIFKDYLFTPIRLDNNNIEKIRKIAFNKFNYEMGKSIRSFEGKIRSVEKILLVDKYTFMHINNYDFDLDILQKMKDLLDIYLEKKDIIGATMIYSMNENELERAGIKTKQALYSLLKYYYSDEFKRGEGNTLEFYKKGADILSKDEILEKVLITKDGCASKIDILEETGWEEAKLENIVALSKVAIRRGSKVELVKDFDVTNEEKEKILQIVNELIKESGFTTSKLIYDKVIFDKNLMYMIARNKSKEITPDVLGQLVKKFANNIKGYMSFITYKNSKLKTIENAIERKFKCITSRDEIKNYLKRFKYNDVSISKVFNNILENKSFVELSHDKLINSKEFKVSKISIDSLIGLVEEYLAYNNYDYVVLNDLEIYKEGLSICEYEWNRYLMKSILLRNGYKSIDRIYDGDRSISKLIVVKNEIEINSYEELLYNVIKNDYKGKMQEIDVYNYLEKRGLVYKQERSYDKMLPYDLKQKGRIVIDEVKRVIIRK